MKTNSRRGIVAVAMLLTLALVNTGCQSFTMTQAEFEQQQAGKSVDPGVGATVGAVGSAAYLGYAIGSVVAGGMKK